MPPETTTAPCPDCGQKIRLWAPLKVGEEVICPHCEADLEVVNLDPVELDWASIPSAEDEEDWDEDEEDWDEEWDEDEDR